MQAATGARLIEQLRGELASPPPRPAFEIDTARYRDPAYFERERAALFSGSRPRIAIASRDLAPNACVPIDTATVSALLVRGPDGRARAFRNACRHRATRLVDAPCAAKALVCPYHGWTYDLTGELIHAPHPESFASLDREGPVAGKRALHELPVDERHGLIWLGTRDASAYLGALDADLAALGLADHVTFQTARVTRRCNWKLVVEAFLDGYHIRVLHRDSIYRFFIDAASLAERVAPHVRAVTARRALRDRAVVHADDPDLRELATPSFTLFPATTIIVHPDFVSIVIVDPLAPDATEYHHAMLVPAARAGEREHWERSWHLIEETVFQREDLWVCEQVQRGIAVAPPGDHLMFGALENAIAWFHAEIDDRVR